MAGRMSDFSVANHHELGSVAASEKLIQDLYLDLRRRTRYWASITHQTAQARMGYVGQHLVSVVTGLQGGRSGARGFDLVHADGLPGEIKTCYRVDQLGRCRGCSAGVSPDDKTCPECGSTKIERKDDSKWLISFRHDSEFGSLLEPKFYYLVLFEFVNLNMPDTIRASIWSVDPNNPGFVLAMIDYYKNIRALSKSKAPFNLWPYSLKFELMGGTLIYRSLIHNDDRIDTEIFPGRDSPTLVPLSELTAHSKARVDMECWGEVWSACVQLGANLPADAPQSKKDLLGQLEAARGSLPCSEGDLIELIALCYYRKLVTPHIDSLPKAISDRVLQLLAS